MDKNVFIGSYDKTDMLIYVAKLLTLLGKKVILIDTTVLKKSRYIVPTMVNEKKYITTYENVDVAIGFNSFEEIKRYQRKNSRDEEYDIALIDIDRAISYENFQITSKDTHYFVTSFDMYNLKKGLQVLTHIERGAKVKKVYYTKNMTIEEDEYVNFLSEKYKINWDKDDIIFFPFETADLDAIYTNQRDGRIQMKGLSSAYVDSILYIVEEITGESSGKVKKVYKMIDN